jgi:predicted RNA-binding protein YlqC (UPF0109 family)
MSVMKEFVEYIAKNLVDHPEAVAVTEVDGETAKSIRTLLTAASAKRGKRAVLEILE